MYVLIFLCKSHLSVLQLVLPAYVTVLLEQVCLNLSKLFWVLERFLVCYSADHFHFALESETK